jgi:hypothetical protein
LTRFPFSELPAPDPFVTGGLHCCDIDDMWEPSRKNQSNRDSDQSSGARRDDHEKVCSDRHPHHERQLVPARIFLRRHLHRLPEINVSLIFQLSNQVQWVIVVRIRTLAVRSGRTIIALGSIKFLLKLRRLHFSLPASGKTMYLDTVIRNAFQGLALKVLETAMTFEAALVLLISSAVRPLQNAASLQTR